MGGKEDEFGFVKSSNTIERKGSLDKLEFINKYEEEYPVY